MCALEMFTVLRSTGAAEGLQAHSSSPSSHFPTGFCSTNKETLHHHELRSKKGPTTTLPVAVHNKEEHGRASSNSYLENASLFSPKWQ